MICIQTLNLKHDLNDQTMLGFAAPTLACQQAILHCPFMDSRFS